MIKRWIPAAVALTAAVIFTTSAVLAKGDDAEKMKEDRDKVREAYEDPEKKAGYTFYDLAYWVDVAKLEETRWSKNAVREPKHDRGLQLHAKWENAASAAGGMTIEVFINKLIHKEQKGSVIQPYSYPFDNLGESVSCVDHEAIIEGFYEDWKKGSKDVIEDQCTDVKKSKFKVPKYEAAAVATDKDSETRERREWYVWSDGKQVATYVVEIRYGTALLDNENLLEKGRDFVKNLKELKDKRVKWE